MKNCLSRLVAPAIAVRVAVLLSQTGMGSAADAQMYRRLQVSDAALVQPFIREISYPEMTAATCVGICLILKPNGCKAVSFVRSNGEGFCKAGTDPSRTQVVAASGSTVYFVDGAGVSSTSSNSPTTTTAALLPTTTPTTTPQTTPTTTPAAVDNLTYYRVEGPFQTLGGARASCVQQNMGNLAVQYPNEASHAKILAQMQPGDITFLDIVRAGDFTQGKFATGLGVVFDVKQPSVDPRQHWTSIGPDATSDFTGSVVLLWRDPTTGVGYWDDSAPIAPTTTVNVAICADDGHPYRFIPSTGKYYRMFTDVKYQSAANATCISDGGRLANPLKVDGLFDVLDLYATATELWVDGYLQQDGTSWAFADGTVVLGSSDRLRWAADLFFNTPFGPCVVNVGSQLMNGACDVDCAFLCEKDTLT